MGSTEFFIITQKMGDVGTKSFCLFLPTSTGKSANPLSRALGVC